ncbi:hypothetical protein GDO78_022755 [Eleutherodactylus coqui]|uniref:Uncharacterized protein n=1 Tax=Eleutherodactylus coqui TaxID=57060 RepID=A0A8J6B2I2_ELECQ|nr:hypothetical protein GDO78_022755 [Eleutherodactylus coqui]
MDSVIFIILLKPENIGELSLISKTSISRLCSSRGFSATSSKCSRQLRLDPHRLSLSILSYTTRAPFFCSIENNLLLPSAPKLSLLLLISARFTPRS